MGLYDRYDNLRGEGNSVFRNTRLARADDSGLAAGQTPVNRDVSAERLMPAQSESQRAPSVVADTMAFGDFAHVPLSVGLNNDTPIITRPQVKRSFLQIQNNDPAKSMFVAFGAPASATYGITILAGGSLTLDIRVPQNDVYVSGSAAGTLGMLTYCNQALGAT